MKSNTKIATGPITRSFLAGILVFCVFFLNSLNGSAQLVAIPDPVFVTFLQQAYPSVMSGNNLIIANAGSVPGYFNCSNKNILNVFGVQYFTNVDSVNVSHNNIYLISQFTSPISFKTFDCSYNNLGVLPLFLNSPSILKIDCRNNIMHTLPTFALTPNLDTLYCHNNKFTFEDLLKVPAYVTTFIYTPQAQVQIDGVAEVEEGQPYTLKFPADDTVTSSIYKLYRDDVLISTQPTNTYLIANVSHEDAGVYRWEVNNTLLPALTLTTNAQNVIVKNKDQEIFTPDGDGNQDSYYIPYMENIRIYNHTGNLVKEMQGPSYWDGTDSAGKQVRTGTYIIRSGDNELVVTLIR